MNTIKPLDHIATTKAYVPGGKLQGAAGPVAMLASNENPFGPSPRAVQAIRAAAAAGLQIYPDPDYGALRAAIAAAKGIADPARVVTSAGSDEIIHLLTQCYAGPGDEVLFTEHAFSMYEVSTRAHGATAVKAPETDMKAGVNAILGGVSPRTKILFLANPNNPTGTMLTVEELEALQDALPPHVLFVVDGAYSEYLGPEYEAALRDLVDRRDTTVMMRTFSKIYGLAAARLGWAYMPRPIADTFQRIRGPFNVNALGLPTPESHANFVVPEFGSAARAADANQYLKDEDILVRAIGGYGLPTKLRITVGSAEDNTRVLDALKAFTAKR